MQASSKNKVVIIGSGFSGLAAACCLAKEGVEVSVLEKNSNVGGRARSFEENGFMYDMGPSWYWMPDVFEDFFSRFGKKVSSYYDLKLLSPSFRVFFSREEQVDVPASPKELEDLFESIEKGSGKRLRKFLNEAKYKYDVSMKDLVFRPAYSWLEFVDSRVLTGFFRLHLLQSFEKYVRKYFRDKRLLSILEFPVLFLGARPKDTPALYSMMNYAGLSLGTWYPMGGMKRIADAMEELASSLGVRFYTDTAANKIVTGNGKVRGVTAQGEKFFEADAVVSSADYHFTEQKLLDPSFRNYGEGYWEKRTMAPSSLIFYLGINRKLPGLQHHNLFFDEEFSAHAKEIYVTPRYPSRPLFYVCAPSRTDDTVAPRGMENLFILMPVASGLHDDEATREKYFELLISRMERITGEKFREDIIYKRSYCVNDFTQDYNAFKGNAYGLANTLWQTAVLKPSIRNKKLKNLFYAGQLTVPGPGVPPALISGQIVAKEVLKLLNKN